jgi:hypothetical protein
MVQNKGQTGFSAKHQVGGCVGDKAIQSLELSGTGSAFSSLQVLCEGVTAFVLALLPPPLRTPPSYTISGLRRVYCTCFSSFLVAILLLFSS